MKPLIVLIAVFALSCLACFIVTGNAEVDLNGHIAMAAMLVFTSVAHFAFSKGMAMMIPPILPFPLFWVYATGFVEIAAAAGLLIPATRYFTAIMLIVFFVMLLPANIYAAMKNINLEKADLSGNGPGYLWFRIPLQLLFIGWIVYFAILN